MAILTFKEAAEKFTTARFKDKGKPLCSNTRLVKVDDNTYGIKLHKTVIVHIHADDTYSLFMKGWNTVTTRDRLNAFSPVQLSSVSCVPIVYVYAGMGWTMQSEFYDGIKIDADGFVISEKRDPSPKLKAVRAERNKRAAARRKALNVVFQHGHYRIRHTEYGYMVETKGYRQYSAVKTFETLERAKAEVVALRITEVNND